MAKKNVKTTSSTIKKKVGGKEGAPFGNKNAEAWSLDEAKELFERSIELTNEKVIINLGFGKKLEGYKFDFIGEIAREMNQYRMIYNYLSNKFPELNDLHNKLLSYIEQNCYSNTKKGVIREATGIVNLKANYKWKDRYDHTSDDQPIGTKMTEEEFQEQLKKANKILDEQV